MTTLKDVQPGNFLIVPTGDCIWLKFFHQDRPTLFGLTERRWLNTNVVLDNHEINVLHCDFYHYDQCVARSFEGQIPKLVPADRIENPRERRRFHDIGIGAIFSDGLDNPDLYIKVSLSEAVSLSDGKLTAIPDDIKKMPMAILMLSCTFYLADKAIGSHS